MGDEANGSQGGGKALGLPLVLFGLAVGVGVGVGTMRGAVADGLAVSLALCMGVVIYLMARNPPESSGRGGNSAINFGLDSRSCSRQRPATGASAVNRKR